jgi:hypothetical protein
VSGDGRKRVLALGSKGGGRTTVKREGREKLLVERREKAFSEIKQRLPADRSLALTHTLSHLVLETTSFTSHVLDLYLESLSTSPPTPTKRPTDSHHGTSHLCDFRPLVSGPGSLRLFTGINARANRDLFSIEGLNEER